jgi:hypothetical protein
MAGGAAWGHAPSCFWGGVSLVKSIRRPIQAGRAANQATASVGRLATPPSAPRFITKHFSPVSPVSVYSMKPKPDLKPRNFFETDFGFTRFQRDFLKPESET